MREAEQRRLPYLFKLRRTKNVKLLIARIHARGGWRDAGQGWQGREAELRLDGWSRERRVVVLRRRLKDGVVAAKDDEQFTSQREVKIPDKPASRSFRERSGEGFSNYVSAYGAVAPASCLGVQKRSAPTAAASKRIKGLCGAQPPHKSR